MASDIQRLTYYSNPENCSALRPWAACRWSCNLTLPSPLNMPQIDFTPFSCEWPQNVLCIPVVELTDCLSSTYFVFLA